MGRFFLFTELQHFSAAAVVVAIHPDVLDMCVEGLSYEGTPSALVEKTLLGYRLFYIGTDQYQIGLVSRADETALLDAE